MGIQGKHAYVYVDKTWANVPWVYIYVDRPDDGAETRHKYHTDWAGRLCRSLSFAEMKDLKHRLAAAGKQYKPDLARFHADEIWFASDTKKFRGYCTAEPEFDGERLLQPSDLKDLSFKEGTISAQAGLFKCDDPGLVPAGKRLLLELAEGTPPDYKFVNTALTRYVDDKSGTFDAGDGVSEEAFKKDLERLKSILKRLEFVRAMRLGGKEEGESADARGVGVIDEARGEGLHTVDFRGRRIAIENAFYQASDTLVEEGLTGKEGDRGGRVLQQVWSLSTRVSPMTGAPGADGAADEIARRLVAAVKERAAKATAGAKSKDPKAAEAKAAIQAGEQLITSNGSNNHPRPKILGIPAGDPLAAAFDNLYLGVSGVDLRNAFVDALDAASKRYKITVTSRQDAQSKAASGKPDGADATFSFERPLTSAAFTFATNHWVYSFDLVPIAKRVKKWWDSVPAARKSGSSQLTAYVDSYTSAKGEADWNRTLSRWRLESVVNAVKEHVGGATIVARSHMALVDGGWRTTSVDGKDVEQPGSAPDPECLRYVEVYKDLRLLELKRASSKDNPWDHRVVTVRLVEKVKSAPIQGGKDGSVEAEYVRDEVVTETSMPVAKATLVAYQKVGGNCYAWVLVQPGDPEKGISLR